jgi:hypothetical protein
VIVNNNVTSRDGLISGAMIGGSMLALGLIQLDALRLPDLEALAVISVTILLGCGLGGLIGQLVTRSIGFGFQPDLINRAARQLDAGEVILLLQVRHRDVSILERELVALNARVQQYYISEVT